MGDGAYDGEPVLQAVFAKQADAIVIVPPHKTAVLSRAGNTRRDEHVREIATRGRIAWRKKSGHGLRAHVELAIQRHRHITGSVMKARALAQQKTEPIFASA